MPPKTPASPEIPAPSATEKTEPAPPPPPPAKDQPAPPAPEVKEETTKPTAEERAAAAKAKIQTLEPSDIPGPADEQKLEAQQAEQLRQLAQDSRPVHASEQRPVAEEPAPEGWFWAHRMVVKGGVAGTERYLERIAPDK